MSSKQTDTDSLHKKIDSLEDLVAEYQSERDLILATMLARVNDDGRPEVLAKPVAEHLTILMGLRDEIRAMGEGKTPTGRAYRAGFAAAVGLMADWGAL